MAENNEVYEPRKDIAEDYYAGYYWGNDPYQSYDLPGRKNDSELKSTILERLRATYDLVPNSITISVMNGIVVHHIMLRHIKNAD